MLPRSRLILGQTADKESVGNVWFRSALVCGRPAAGVALTLRQLLVPMYCYGVGRAAYLAVPALIIATFLSQQHVSACATVLPHQVVNVLSTDRPVACPYQQGMEPLKYQWYKDDKKLSVATSDSPNLIIAEVSPLDAGTYYCQVRGHYHHSNRVLCDALV